MKKKKETQRHEKKTAGQRQSQSGETRSLKVLEKKKSTEVKVGEEEAGEGRCYAKRQDGECDECDGAR